MTAQEHLMTAGEVASWLKVSRSWVSDHSSGRRRPVLPSIKLGNGKRAARRYRRADVERFLVECQQFLDVHVDGRPRRQGAAC